METSKYGIAVQVSRNNSQEMLHLETYRPFINVLSNNHYNSCYQASEEFELPLPYKWPIILPPESTPT